MPVFLVLGLAPLSRPQNYQKTHGENQRQGVDLSAAFLVDLRSGAHSDPYADWLYARLEE
jgi:hypothetical protein